MQERVHIYLQSIKINVYVKNIVSENKTFEVSAFFAVTFFFKLDCSHQRVNFHGAV